MGLLDKLRHELIDIVEWIDDSQSTLVWRFPRYHNQIKNGARLIVRPGQQALFVNEGQVADVFGPGTYELTTKNVPILATLQGWKHGFESPFKAEVYFVSTRQLTGLKWGTPNPIMLRDADFGPVRLRAFGTYNLQATDARALITELVGTDSNFEVDEVGELLRSLIVTAFADLLGTSKIAALDLAANYRELSETLRQHAVERVDDEYGLDIPQLFIVNISFPKEVEEALDTRTSMGVIGDMNRFQQYQMGQAMTAAAENPNSGGAADGMGLGMGFAMANQMMRGQPGAFGAPQAGPSQAPPPGAVPPPPPPPALWYVAEGGQTTGPFSPAQLGEMATLGRLRPESMVWRAGMASWLAASQVPDISSWLQAPPPPPPGG